MSNLPSLELATLVTVTGGQSAPNTSQTKVNGNVGVTVKGVQVGVQGSYEDSATRTNPAQCAQDVRAAGGTASDVLRCYSTPSN
jgi:hypothetical protein